MAWFPAGWFPSDATIVASTYDWPDPDPEGPVLAPLAKLATLLAASPTFRTACGLATDDPYASEKLLDGARGFQRRIFYPEVDWENFHLRPSAVLQFGPDWSLELDAGGGQNYTRPRGNLRLVLFGTDEYPEDVECSMRAFGIYLGQLLDDLRSQFALDDELAGENVRWEYPPSMPPVEVAQSLGYSYWHCSFVIEWSS